MQDKFYIDDVMCILERYCGQDENKSQKTGVAIKYRRNNAHPAWLMNIDNEDVPNFFLAGENILRQLMMPESDDAFLDLIRKHLVDSFSGIELWSYEEIASGIEKCKEPSAAKLIEYAVAVSRCRLSDLEKLLVITPGMEILDKEMSVTNI